MNPHVFREFDIRGHAEHDFTDRFVADLGRAIGTAIARRGGARIALGRDARLSSPRIREALTEGLTETGMSVLDVGIGPTPMLYFAVHHLALDGGVQITGSHNPPDENGFKILFGRSAIFGEEIQRLRTRIEQRDFVRAERGTCERLDIEQSYLGDALARLAPGRRRFRVVLDGGNGVGGKACATILRAMGFEVKAIHCEPDGRFPSHAPDPTVEENLADLRREVAAFGAELGIGLDGDGDRIGVVDSEGRLIAGDRLLILLARALLDENPGSTVIADVKCSRSLFDEVTRAGGRALMWKVGHAFIKAKMHEEGALLAGELSGHYFFADRHFGFDDGLYAAARLVELLSRSEKTLAEHASSLPHPHVSPEVRVRCADQHKMAVVEGALDAFRASCRVVEVDGGRIEFEHGWALIRASQTGPGISLRFEADTEPALRAIRRRVERAVGAAAGRLGVALSGL